MKEIFTCSPLFAVTVKATGWNEAKNKIGHKFGINCSSCYLYLESGLKAEIDLQAWPPLRIWCLNVLIAHTDYLAPAISSLCLANTRDSPITSNRMLLETHTWIFFNDFFFFFNGFWLSNWKHFIARSSNWLWNAFLSFFIPWDIFKAGWITNWKMYCRKKQTRSLPDSVLLWFSFLMQNSWDRSGDCSHIGAGGDAVR